MKVVADYFASFPYYDFSKARNRNLRDLFFVVIAADQEIRKKISQICGFFQSAGSFSTDYMCVVVDEMVSSEHFQSKFMNAKSSGA